MNYFYIFFFNDTATTEIYTLSLHDALPIFAAQGLYLGRPHRRRHPLHRGEPRPPLLLLRALQRAARAVPGRSEEHTSELQSRQYLVCRLLLEKKKNRINILSSLVHHHHDTL